MFWNTKKCYQNEPKFNGVYLRNKSLKVKDEAYIINLDEYKSIGIHWVAFFVKNNNVTYFDNFGVEHIPKEIKEFIRNKNITNIYRVQAYNLIMWEYICIGFINFVLRGKSFLDYRNWFSPNEYEKNDKIIQKYFQ